MKPQKKQRRKRGVILTPQGLKKLIAAKSEAESCENNDIHYTLENLNERTGLDPDTLMKVFACEVGVDKQTLTRCFRAFNLLLEASDYQLPQPDEVISSNHPIQNPNSLIQNRRDWGEAADVSVFYGRTEELATLKHWILGDRCRLVALLGMGGMGKTCLSVKLAEQVQDDFEFVIWRSLHNAPLIKDTLAELIRFLSNEQEVNLPETVYGKVSRLIHYLRVSRCLLVLDNVETILQECTLQDASCNYGTGYFRQGYEGYGELLRRVGEAYHQSCLLLTSREKPKEIALLAGETLPVRVLQLKGLQVTDIQAMFRAKGSFSGSTAELSQLVECYAGNPLALKIVATTIQQLFDGSMSEFLKQKTAVFGNILNLLEQQFQRLSEVEKEVINWLVINRQPASFSEMREKISSSVSVQTLLEALESLEARSLIEKKAALFSVQPVVMEYISHQLTQEKITEVPLRFFSLDEYPRLAANR